MYFCCTMMYCDCTMHTLEIICYVMLLIPKYAISEIYLVSSSFYRMAYRSDKYEAKEMTRSLYSLSSLPAWPNTDSLV